MTTDELVIELEAIGTAIAAEWRPGGWSITWHLHSRRYVAVAPTLYAALFEVRQQAMRDARQELT